MELKVEGMNSALIPSGALTLTRGKGTVHLIAHEASVCLDSKWQFHDQPRWNGTPSICQGGGL